MIEKDMDERTVFYNKGVEDAWKLVRSLFYQFSTSRVEEIVKEQTYIEALRYYYDSKKGNLEE